MITYVHVDRHALQRTREDGKQRPTVVVGDEKNPHKNSYYAVELPEKSVVKSLSTQLSCGASIVVETMGDVKPISRMHKEENWDFDALRIQEFVPVRPNEESSDCYRCGAPKAMWIAKRVYEKGYELCEDCYREKKVLNFFAESPRGLVLLGRVVEPEGKSICK